MSALRLTPLILAVALFMENMDSTVIATSLAAIAHDVGTEPIALKLALTAYLVALAIFIPVSSWMADKFGARNVFRWAMIVFIIGSVCCAVSNSLLTFVLSRFLQGRRDDDAGGAAGAGARDAAQPAGRRNGVAQHSRPRRPDRRPASGRLHHHFRQLALDLLDQRAAMPSRSPTSRTRTPGRPTS